MDRPCDLIRPLTFDGSLTAKECRQGALVDVQPAIDGAVNRFLRPGNVAEPGGKKNMIGRFHRLWPSLCTPFTATDDDFPITVIVIIKLGKSKYPVLPFSLIEFFFSLLVVCVSFGQVMAQ